MKFDSNHFYHVFNRGNNRQLIFLQERNYDFFLSKLKTTLNGYCHIVAYCLMPNHFHLLLFVDESSKGLETKSKPTLQVLEQKLGTLQSSYTRAINNQENKTGSLFQSKIKVVPLDSEHISTCFHYIHQNPLKANLANNFNDWLHSSYREYQSKQEGICNRDIAYQLLDIPNDSQLFEELSKDVVVNETVISKISTMEKSRPTTLSGQATGQHIAIVGAGLVGSLLSIYLAKRGFKVSVFERRPDMRKLVVDGGRSINLALSNRGIRALEEVGLANELKKVAIPMHGRMMHDRKSNLSFLPYGKDGQFINSISRSNLNIVLMNKAESLGVNFLFEQKITSVDFEKTELKTSRPTTSSGQATDTDSFDAIIGADGAFSVIRHAMQTNERFNYSQEFIEHGYKELHIPADANGNFQFEKNALHIWPRESFMLIALPNPDGSFTGTLFFPFEGDLSFASLKNKNAVEKFLSETFPDAFARMINPVENFMNSNASSLVSIKCFPWTKNKTLLIGDAAHAIVPFYGQGMNTGFEDCRILNQLLDQTPDWQELFHQFQKLRKPNADAIGKLSLDNFIEMRDLVADNKFLLRKKIEAKLHQLFPEQWVPLYTMVTFKENMNYADAYAIGQKQNKIMDEVMQKNNIETTWEQLDFENIVSKLDF